MVITIRPSLLRKVVTVFAALILLVGLLPGFVPGVKAADAPQVKLQILETTDLHANMMDYDYYSDKATTSYGLARTAQLIKKHREDSKKNTILVDNGDTIQGSPLGEYINKNPDQFPDGLPIYKTLNTLGYDAGTVGNHEFNYGLDFLNKSLEAADFPIVNANVMKTDGSYYFDPYEIVEKEVTDESGNKQTIKIGYTGFAPPQIMTWDKANLEGKVVANDIVASAQKVIPEMQKAGADLIVVLAHTGIVPHEQAAGAENAVYDLATKVPGIDAIVSGHQHGLFPSDDYTGDKIDSKKGTINGVPVVMAKNWGSHLGVIDLTLQKGDNGWEVTDSQSTAESIESVGSADTEITETIKNAHEKTLEYVRKPVGQTEAPINSFFALVQDDPSIQIVTDAQKWYTKKAMANSKFKDLPVLSAGAPFKAGGRNGAGYYTNIPKGNLAIKNVGDLYLYDNTLYVLKLTGAQIKEWLEMSAGQFNQIDPTKSEAQPLINDSFPTYNYDVIDGVTYQIDVTQPAKYNSDGEVADADASRIKNLQYDGKPIDPNQEFLVASNNYRASGGGNFPNIGTDKVVHASTVENRQVLIDYITEQKTINPSADGNWSFAPVNGDVAVSFESSPAAKAFAGDSISYVGEGENGFARYSMNLPKDDTWDLTVLHTNDTHAHLDNVARKATLINQERQNSENHILVDSGDVFSGDLYFTEWNGLADLEFMNKIGYDAMTFGNHEFDKGPATLAEFVKEADFPIVSSNVDVSKEPALNTLVKDPTTFKAGEAKEPGIYEYVILDVNGEKVGVFGMTTEDTGEASSPGENITFNDAAESAKKTVDQIDEKTDKIIALSHLGYARDPGLAKEVEGIDVIVGGHSHTQLDQPVIIAEDATPTVIVQANEWNKYLGRLDVAFDEKGVVVPDETTGKLIPIDENVAEDTETKEILDEKYKSKLEETKARVVGETSVPLDGERNNVRTKETNLGNLIADGMLEKARSTEKGADTDIAIQNGGGIRGPIDQGEITLGEVLTVMPFGNTLYLVDVTGEQLIEALENGVKGIEEIAGPFPQVAGMRYSFTQSKPAGERILSVEIENEDGSYSPVDPNKTYKLATNNFVGKGGDGYDVLKEGKNAIDLGIADYEIFTDYLENHGTVTPAVEGRIIETFVPTVENGKIVPNEAFTDYIRQANTVEITLPEFQDDLTSIEIQLSKEQIQALKATASPVLTLRNKKVGLKIPVKKLSDTAMTIKITKTEPIEKALTDAYDFSIVQNGKEVTAFEEPVTLLFTIGDEAEDPSIYQIDRAGNTFTQVDSVYTDGVISGFVNHFSEYTVLEQSVVENPDNGDQNGDGGPNGDGGDNGDQNDDQNGGNQNGDGIQNHDQNGGNQNGDGTQNHDQNGGDQNGDGTQNNDQNGDGQNMPNTATQMFNLLVVGLVILAIGAAAFLYFRRKQLMKHSNL